MGIFSLAKTAVKAASGYGMARTKERTTALGGGGMLFVAYFYFKNPDKIPAPLFYAVFTAFAIIALLKTEFMKAMGKAIVQSVKKGNRDG